MAECAGVGFSAVCAVVGGFLAQDILKVLAAKDKPTHNFFFYDAMEGYGLVETVFST